ncbi:MAG: fused MFS/spermidine synthase [Bacteroidales bacterium]
MGKLADKKPFYSILALAIGISGILILISTLLKDILLSWMLDTIENLEVISVLASILLFSLPAFFLGMVSPYAVKLKIKDVKTSGATAGYLYAISTAGSITGTFLAGFYLIPSFRISVILYIFTLVLLSISIGLFLIFKNSGNKSIN